MNIDDKIEKVEEKIDNISLATEVLCHTKDTIKKLWILIIALIMALLITNTYWIHKFTQYDFVSYEQTSDDGTNNFVGRDGDINNGKTNN